jgi:hypothetical protein
VLHKFVCADPIGKISKEEPLKKRLQPILAALQEGDDFDVSSF